MKKFDELVKPDDRKIIQTKISDELSNIRVFGNKHNITSIDVLILFVKRVKYEYTHNTNNQGLCAAKQEAMYYMYNKHPFRKYWYIRYSDLLGKIFHPKYKEYAGLNDYWFDGREQGYWWRINYYSPFSEAYRMVNNIKIVRLAKPRILFLNWVIDVLIAYKNEYNNI